MKPASRHFIQYVYIIIVYISHEKREDGKFRYAYFFKIFFSLVKTQHLRFLLDFYRGQASLTIALCVYFLFYDVCTKIVNVCCWSWTCLSSKKMKSLQLYRFRRYFFLQAVSDIIIFPRAHILKLGRYSKYGNPSGGKIIGFGCLIAATICATLIKELM